MQPDILLSKSVTINTCQDKVWNALADPEIIKEYLFKTHIIDKCKVGSEIIFHGEYNGHKYRDHKIIFERTPNGLINYNYWSGLLSLDENDSNFSIITYNITAKKNNQTELIWSHKGYKNEELYKDLLYKIDSFLTLLKDIVEH